MARLVLTRGEGESIMIGDDVEIRVMEGRGGAVKLVIEAPPWVKILRTELWLRDRGIKAPTPAARGAADSAG